MERTFVALKPDAVKRGFMGEIIKRFENKGYKIIALKMLNVSAQQAASHYEEHAGKPFYDGLIKYITSGPIVAMVLEGQDVVSGARHLMGATKPNAADVGSIRADLALVQERNAVHGSDSVVSAVREIKIYFDESEFCTNYKTSAEMLLEP
jgi:nucleoside-diphosphate kinase